MFLKGSITKDLEPVLDHLYVLGKNKKKFPITAILDTGFNGELALPQKDYVSYFFEPLGIKSFELADGQIVQQEIFVAFLIIKGKKYPVEATLTRSNIALLGMELIRNKIALFNLKTNKIFVRD